METENKVSATVESPEVPKLEVKSTIVIGAKDPCFDSMSWVARAVDLKGFDSLKYLFSDGENLVATDEKRLHCYTASPLPSGMYRLTKRVKNELQLEKDPDAPTFPDYKKIVPELEPDFPRVELQGNTYLVSRYVQYARLVRAMDTRDALNLQYLDDVRETGVSFTCHITGRGKALYFVAADRWALVMPMNAE